MITKRPIVPARLRKLPRQFSWIDHLLVRGGHIKKVSVPGAALYLFLVTVGDAQGLSYYGDQSIMAQLSMDSATLEAARDDLISAELIAFKRPLYQVLSLEPCQCPPEATGQRLAQILNTIGALP